MISFADKIKEQEEIAKREGYGNQGGGDWYKFIEGDNRFRVLAEPEMIFEAFKVGICYTDCGYEGNAKMLTYILDRKDNKIKLAKLPYGVGTTIAGYEQDEEYAFQGFPMPYDIKVNAVGAGTKEVKYTVVPGRASTPVDANTLRDLSKKKSIAEIIQKMKENQKQKHIDDGTWQKNQDKKAEGLASLKKAREAGAEEGEQEYYPEDINPEDIPF